MHICLYCIAGAQKSSPKSSMFTINDIDSMLDFKYVKKEKEIASTPPALRAVTTRSKSVAHKRNIALKMILKTLKHFHDMITDVSIPNHVTKTLCNGLV